MPTSAPAFPGGGTPGPSQGVPSIRPKRTAFQAPGSVNPGQYIRDAFNGNIIPASRINPISAKVVAYYPLPNFPGQGIVGETWTESQCRGIEALTFRVVVDLKPGVAETELPQPVRREGGRQSDQGGGVRLRRDGLFFERNIGDTAEAGPHRSLLQRKRALVWTRGLCSLHQAPKGSITS